MIVQVYRMRHEGKRLYRDSRLLTEGAVGWLAFRMDENSRTMHAHLFVNATSVSEVLPPLWRARILRIEGAIHIVGTEYIGRRSTKARAEAYRQSWLCATSAEAALRLLDRVPACDPDSDQLDDDDTPEPPLEIG